MDHCAAACGEANRRSSMIAFRPARMAAKAAKFAALRRSGRVTQAAKASFASGAGAIR